MAIFKQCVTCLRIVQVAERAVAVLPNLIKFAENVKTLKTATFTITATTAKNFVKTS